VNEAGTTRVLPARPGPATPPPAEQGGAAGRWKRWAVFGAAGVIVAGLLVSAALWIAGERSGAPAPRPAGTAPAAPAGAAVERQNVERAVSTHWSLLVAGSYDQAYDALAPAFKAEVPREAWTHVQEQDELSAAEVETRAELGPSGDAARAEVMAMRTVATSGCFTWTGSYDLQRVDGAWRIAGSHLTRSPCT
jgi:hypothetical protein